MGEYELGEMRLASLISMQILSESNLFAGYIIVFCSGLSLLFAKFYNMRLRVTQKYHENSVRIFI